MIPVVPLPVVFIMDLTQRFSDLMALFDFS